MRMTGRAAEAPAYFGKDLEAMSFARNYHNWILDEFRPYLRGNVAEVGAGTGDFSLLLLASGISSLTAFEPSSNMFRILEERLRGHAPARPVHGYFEGAATRARYDAIVYVNVLEHIERDAAEMKTAAAALVPGGHVVVFVPALSWLYSDLDRDLGHYRRYTRQSLVKVVQGAGLNVVKADYFDFAGIGPWFVNFVLLKNTLTAGSVSLYDNLVVPVARRIERLIPPPVGKNVLLVAQRGL